MEKFEEQSQQGGMAWIPGATTIGVVCHDGVILASEKRVSYGNFVISKGGKKVFQTHRQNRCCLRWLSLRYAGSCARCRSKRQPVQHGRRQSYISESCSQIDVKHTLQPPHDATDCPNNRSGA